MSIFLICLNYLSYLSNLFEITCYLNKKFLLLEPSPISNAGDQQVIVFPYIIKPVSNMLVMIVIATALLDDFSSLIPNLKSEYHNNVRFS